MEKNKILFILIGIFVFFGIFLRFYNLRNNIQFDFDQENYLAFPAKNILVDHHLTLIGPKTGVGNLYIEPLYYYIVALFYAIFNMDPISGSLLAGTLATFFILLSFILNRSIFNLEKGLYFALIWSASARLIDWDRTPWNPNLLPIASILVFIGLWVIVYKSKNYGWIFLTLGIIMGLNSHFTSLFFIAVTVITLILHKKTNNKYFIICLAFVFLSFIPLFIFNVRHNHLLYHNLLNFLVTSTQRSGSFLGNIIPLTLYLLDTIGRVILLNITWFVTQLAGVIFLLLLFYFHKDQQIQKFIKLFVIYLLVYIIGLSFYKGDIPNYYFLGLIPPALIGYSLIISKISRVIPFFSFLLILISIANLIKGYNIVNRNNPASLANKQAVVTKIKELSDNKPVNIIYNMDLGWHYGYEYLFYYYKVNFKPENKNTLKYIISFPSKLAPNSPHYTFGDIALTEEK